MLTSDFDYPLPVELIAQEPPETRGSSRMMVLNRTSRDLIHAKVADLPQYLRAGDMLVLNDTRVFPARIHGAWRDSGGHVELLLVAPENKESTTAGCCCSRWRALCGSGRPLRPDLCAVFGDGILIATLETCLANGEVVVALQAEEPLMVVLEKYGTTPLPPYIHRTPDDPRTALDTARYQTVFARTVGAVAAPTAGLHLTNELLTGLAQHGIGHTFITLHVGPGTFRPVKSEHVENHVMDAERYEISADSAQAIAGCRARGGRVVAVGSTTVRTLESVAAQNNGNIVADTGNSELFIRSPYDFKIVDAMLTNFHLPKSTLLMMVAALAGREYILDAYKEAVRSCYRFFSYGDCMLIL